MSRAQIQKVRFWCDDERIGMGYRDFVTLSVGRKWVMLFSVPALATLKVSMADYHRYATPQPVNPRATLRSLRRMVKLHRRLGRRVPNAAKSLVRELEAA